MTHNNWSSVMDSWFWLWAGVLRAEEPVSSDPTADKLNCIWLILIVLKYLMITRTFGLLYILYNLTESLFTCLIVFNGATIALNILHWFFNIYLLNICTLSVLRLNWRLFIFNICSFNLEFLVFFCNFFMFCVMSA